MCSMEKKWPLGAGLLALAAAGSLALAGRDGPTSATAAPGTPETFEIRAVYAISAQLALDTDRMTVGLAQLRLNASAAKADRR